MHQFVEKNIRGEVRYKAQSCSKTSNKYMKSYGKDKSFKCIIYEEVNNLHGCAMQYLFLVSFSGQHKIKSVDLICYNSKRESRRVYIRN